MVKKLKTKILTFNINLLWAVFLVFSCSHDDYPFPVIQIPLDFRGPIQVNSVQSLTQKSAEDYNENRNGIITGTTLTNWWQNWNTQKPSGISGKLVILHISSGALSGSYITPREDLEIFSYGIASGSSVFGESRDNGVITTPDMVLTGAKFEALLKKYGINPDSDLIVFAPDGVGTTGNIMQVGRAWYNFRYWGVDAKNLAILNGGVGVNSIISNVIRGSRLSAENLGSTYKVSTKRVDNTILKATLKDTMDYANGSLSFTGGSVKLLDARTLAEFKADRTKTWPADSIKATPSGSDSTKAITFEGHIRGATNEPFINLLEITQDNGSPSTNGYRFKSPTDLRTIYSSFYNEGDLIVVYCRTNVRAMISGIASIAILGYPTKFYDGSWLQWGSLAGANGKKANLPSNSPWRTDLTSLSGVIEYNVDANPPGEANVIQNVISNFLAFARNANKIIEEDKKFIEGSGSGGSVGGGSSPGGSQTGNPCG